MTPTSLSKHNSKPTNSAKAFAREREIVPRGNMRNATWLTPHPPYAAKGQGVLGGGHLRPPTWEKRP